MEAPLPPDFKEFLLLLNSEKIDYLLVGGYAVSFHGYSRPTGDLDIWVAARPDNAARVLDAVRRFGFAAAGPGVPGLLASGKILRMGVPPVRIKVMGSISGVEFDACYARRTRAVVDGVPIPIIAIDDLLANKRAAGRPKDLNDLRHLPRDRDR